MSSIAYKLWTSVKRGDTEAVMRLYEKVAEALISQELGGPLILAKSTLVIADDKKAIDGASASIKPESSIVQNHQIACREMAAADKPFEFNVGPQSLSFKESKHSAPIKKLSLPVSGALAGRFNSGYERLSQFTNQPLNKYGWTALHAACYFGHLKLIQFLTLDQCADVNQTNANGWHSLIFAVYGGHLDVVDYLLFESPSTPRVDLRDLKNKRTAREIAAHLNDELMCELFDEYLTNL